MKYRPYFNIIICIAFWVCIHLIPASVYAQASSTVLHGIDVSDYQGSINWSQVAGAGKSFAFVKATSGLHTNESTFTANMNGANAAGLKVGAYHFAYPNYTSANTGTAEAQHFISVAGSYLTSGYLRPVLDVEENYFTGTTAQQKASLSQWIRDFATVIKNQYGADIIIYCTRYYASNYLDADLSAHAYWVPTNDGNESGTPTGMGIWNNAWAFKQYLFGTDAQGNVTATCPGVPGGCDLDSFPGSSSDLNGYLLGQTTASSIASVVPSPASVAAGTVGQSLNVQVQIAGTATVAGYLQVWIYDNSFTTSQQIGTYISGPQTYDVTLTGFSLTNDKPVTANYSIFTQFRPGATSGPLNTNQSGDIESSQTYVVDWQNPTGAPTETTPTISPSGGTYTGSVQVTLYCATFGSSIYYTTDGSTPTPNSIPYTAPFSLTGSATVQAIAVGNGYNDSAIASAVFTVNPASDGAVLSLSTNEINLSSGSGGGVISVYDKTSGTLSWSASTSTSWINVSTPNGMAGSQGTLLQFAVQENDSGMARTGTITVSAPGAGGSPQILVIKQFEANPPVTLADVTVTPTTCQPGQSVTVSCSLTSDVGQYILFGASIFPTGQTATVFNDPANDIAMTVGAGTQTITRTFVVPANAPGGSYDVEVGIWVDNNGNGKIDSGDTLLGEQETSEALTVVPPPVPSYRITTSSSPNTGGGTTGAGTFTSGSTVTVTATANTRYSFAFWSESGIEVSDNAMYSFVATSDRTLVANFTQQTTAALNVVANPPDGGSLTGAGTFPVGSMQTITATANPNWTFTGWNDNVTSPSRSVPVVSGGSTYTANFTQQTAALMVVANPANGGMVSGGGTFSVGSTQTITATADSGWTFTGWSDGNMQAARTVTVVAGGSTYTANFVQQTATLTVLANPTSGGVVSGTGTFPVGSTQNITATANNGWLFTGWNDGNTQSSRAVTVAAGGSTYTANFVQQATLTVLASPANGGTVSGGGTFTVGSTQTISALANSGWTFIGWSDGSIQTTRTVAVVAGGSTYTANFSQQTATLIVLANPTNGGMVGGGGTFAVGSTQTIMATANSGWLFTGWSDSNTQATRTVTVVTGGSNYTANFVQQVATLTVLANPTNGGTVSGGGSNLAVGSMQTISAAPNNGWVFIGWNDSNTQATRVVTVVGGVSTYTANFKFNAPTVSVIATGDGTADEGGKKGKVFFERTGDTSVALTVYYKTKGSAKAGVDYIALPGSVTIPAGETKAKIKIKPIDNTVHDGTTKVKVEVLAPTDGSYTVGDPFLAKIKIIDND